MPRPPAASTQHGSAIRQQIRGQQAPQQAPRAAHRKLSRSPRSEIFCLRYLSTVAIRQVNSIILAAPSERRPASAQPAAPRPAGIPRIIAASVSPTSLATCWTRPTLMVSDPAWGQRARFTAAGLLEAPGLLQQRLGSPQRPAQPAAAPCHPLLPVSSRPAPAPHLRACRLLPPPASARRLAPAPATVAAPARYAKHPTVSIPPVSRSSCHWPQPPANGPGARGTAARGHLGLALT